MSISIVIPVLNEADQLAELLSTLPAGVETIVVDGGSTDTTVEVSASGADKILTTDMGRALQMNAGAAVASGEILVFLHADTRLPHDFVRGLKRFQFSHLDWGRFDVRIDSNNVMFRIVERMMNVRSRVTGICTGDQAMFVRRSVFQQMGGFPCIALMEDIAISKLLKRHSAPFCIEQPVVTSARRWLQNGKLRTILLMWRLRLQYFLGVSPDQLVRRYTR